MPAKSDKQRKAAAIALQAKRSGDKSNLKGASKEMSKMSSKQLKDFAKKKGK